MIGGALLRTFDETQELVARILGCSRLRAFLTFTLPQIKGSVVTGMLFAFVSSLDEVIVAILVSSGRNVTVTKVMFDSLRDEIDPTIAAVSSLMILASFVNVRPGTISNLEFRGRLVTRLRHALAPS
jgi:putative spermidine/putrescine transport system permease protein